MAKSPLSSLSSGLLQLATLVSNFSELGHVKKHVFRAGREVLLAFRELLEIAEQYMSDVNDGGSTQQALHTALGYAQVTIQKLVKQLPRGEEEEYRTVHRKVMSSILEVLESEITRSGKNKSQKAKMKVDVLDAIRKVLLKEMYESSDSKNTKKESAGKNKEPL